MSKIENPTAPATPEAPEVVSGETASTPEPAAAAPASDPYAAVAEVAAEVAARREAEHESEPVAAAEPAAEVAEPAAAPVMDTTVEAAAEPGTAPAEPPAEASESEGTVAAEATSEGGGSAATEATAEGEAKPERQGKGAKEGKEEKEAKEAKGGARKKRKRPSRPRSARSEEFVKPTPEELEAIPSEIVRTAVAEGLPVGGKVIGWNQGGFHVVVEGITSFVPRSSMELGPPHEPAQYLDQEYLFRVLRVEEKGKRLVLSRAAILIEEKKHAAEEARKKIELGAVLKGKVVSLVDFGAFVDLGGVEGLLHVSELRHHRVAHPSEVLEVGQEVEAKVVKLPKKGERASLSLRALEPSPWDGAEQKWPTGGTFTGKVVRKSEFGWFVELAPGVEGLLHPSQLEPGMKPEDPRLADGAEISGWVRELDLQRRRVSLALREVPTGNPWQGVQERYPEGAVVKGTIERIAPFGAFIVLEPGLTGLLPTSEMGLPRGASVGKAYPVGREISLKVAEVDPRRKRISLTRQEKTLEGSKADYQNYVKKSRKAEGMGALAAAFARLKSPES